MPSNPFLQFIRFFLRVSGWIALIPLLIGISASVSALRLQLDLAALNKNGVETIAQITAMHVTESKNTNSASGNTSSHYSISFTFSTLGGAIQSQEHKISRTYYMSHAIGDTLSIRYLPTNPKVAELYSGELAGKSIGAQVVGGAISLLGILLLVFYGRTALTAMRARAHVTAELEAYVTHRPKWPPLMNRMTYQIGLGKSVPTGKTFIRFTPSFRGLKRTDKTRAVETKYGTYWADDLFL